MTGRLSKDQWRELAVPVYRALQDAGPFGLTKDELIGESWTIESLERLADVVWWLRGKGVDIVYRAPTGPGEPGRFVLAAQLPDAWDERVP